MRILISFLFVCYTVSVSIRNRRDSNINSDVLKPLKSPQFNKIKAELQGGATTKDPNIYAWPEVPSTAAPATTSIAGATTTLAEVTTTISQGNTLNPLLVNNLAAEKSEIATQKPNQESNIFLSGSTVIPSISEAITLSFLLGYIGADRFYIGQVYVAAAKLLFFVLFLVLIPTTTKVSVLDEVEATIKSNNAVSKVKCVYATGNSTTIVVGYVELQTLLNSVSDAIASDLEEHCLKRLKNKKLAPKIVIIKNPTSLKELTMEDLKPELLNDLPLPNGAVCKSWKIEQPPFTLWPWSRIAFYLLGLVVFVIWVVDLSMFVNYGQNMVDGNGQKLI